MANPTLGWDKIPVFGWWSDNPGVPSGGRIHLTVKQRIRRVDGRMIYPGGATRSVTIGNLDEQDPDIRTAVHDAMKVRDQAAQGADFDEAAWEARWTQNLTAAIFTSFWAADDPDITPHGSGDEGYKVTVTEELTSAAGRSYPVQPLISHLDLAVPGVNLADVEIPPDAPIVPAPVLAKGQPGGIAALDSQGDVINAHGVKVGTVDPVQVEQAVENWLDENPIEGGVSDWEDLQNKPPVIAAGTTQQAARQAIGAGTSNLTLGTTSGTAKAGDWKPGIDDLPAGSSVEVDWTGSSWPARPTSRTDIRVNWNGGSVSNPPPGALEGDKFYPTEE